MFTTLHYFEKSDFFDENEYFYIYTPNSKLTYQVVSSFKYDDRHILNSFNFSDPEIYQDFLDMIQNPESSNKNVRSSLDKELTINDNIVVLSTCITNQKSNRYLVCGVLISDEKTD
jgi:sortase B